ncbi:MAG: hypothetical protein KC493_01640 [Bacteriovoracaceae bacterium]|nr:hypothetical protein [Bacteriovoracaceae bacterium]
MSTSTITFKEFAIFVQVGKIKEAAMALSIILNLDDSVAETATNFFVSKLQTQPDFFNKLMNLKTALENSDNDAMMILIECFNLNGENLVMALEAAKAIVADS